MIDQQGNVEADLAADLGRRHQSEILNQRRRVLLQARSYWYPIMTNLHRFMIAIARVSVNHDGKGGTAPDPLVGIRVAGLRFENYTLEEMLILHLSLAYWVSE